MKTYNFSEEEMKPINELKKERTEHIDNLIQNIERNDSFSEKFSHDILNKILDINDIIKIEQNKLVANIINKKTPY